MVRITILPLWGESGLWVLVKIVLNERRPEGLGRSWRFELKTTRRLFSSIFPLHDLTPAPCLSSRASLSDSSSPRRMQPLGRRYSPFNTLGKGSGARGTRQRAKSTGLFFLFFLPFPSSQVHFMGCAASLHGFPSLGMVVGAVGGVGGVQQGLCWVAPHFLSIL